MAKQAVAAAGVALGIGQLPPTAGLMQVGRPYAVTASESRACMAFLAGLISHSLKQGRKVVLIAGESPDSLIELLDAHSIDARGEIAAQRLVVLTQSPKSAEQLTQHGADRLLDEIDEFCDAERSLVVLAPADALLNTTDHRQSNRQARAYAQWFRERRATGVFLFDSASAERIQDGMEILDGWFAGLAHLRDDAQRPYWSVEHWRTPEGSLMQRRYGLALSRNGDLLIADGAEIAAQEEKILAAPDHDVVYTCGSTAGATRGLPAAWQAVATPAELLEKAPGAVAATFILELDREREIESTAQLIHDLRLKGGNGVKIVVRERSARLRYNHEMLLMRLGANAVIDASLSPSRFLVAVEALREQVFMREIPQDFDVALRSAMPPAATGYLRPQEYCRAVRETVERGAAIGVRNALLRLMIHPQLSHLEVMRQIRLKRPGDLFTADDRSVYVFLFACREPDIETTLDSVVQTPLAELFEGQIRWIENDVLLNAIDNLERRLRHISTADFGPLLEQPAPAAAPAQPRPAMTVAAVTAATAAIAATVKAEPSRTSRSMTRDALPLKNART